MDYSQKHLKKHLDYGIIKLISAKMHVIWDRTCISAAETMQHSVTKSNLLGVET